MSDILFNGLKTPDGTILISRTVHDYVTHKDANGKVYILDGGKEYVRAFANSDQEFITITTDDDHSIVREYVEWGTYGKEGKDPLRYVKVKDMSTEHILAVLNGEHIRQALRLVFLKELEYRGVPFLQDSV